MRGKWLGFCCIWMAASAFGGDAGPVSDCAQLRRALPEPSAFARLRALGEFRAPLTPEALAFWSANWEDAAASPEERRIALEALLGTPLSCRSAVAQTALRRPECAEIAGSLLYAGDRADFTGLMVEWAQSDADWQSALRQSSRLYWQPEYRSALLKHYRPGMDGEIIDFIPLWLLPGDATGQAILKEILLDPSHRDEYRLQHRLVLWLLTAPPGTLGPELTAYWKSLPKHRFLAQSEVYFLASAALVRNGSAEARAAAHRRCEQIVSPEEQAAILRVFRRINGGLENWDALLNYLSE